jgi:hypothetical protein
MERIMSDEKTGTAVLVGLGFVGIATLASYFLEKSERIGIVATRPGSKPMTKRKEIDNFRQHNIGYNMERFKRSYASRIPEDVTEDDIATVMFLMYPYDDEYKSLEEQTIEALEAGVRDAHQFSEDPGEIFVDRHGNPVNF